jgi:hypothetical protein
MSLNKESEDKNVKELMLHFQSQKDETNLKNVCWSSEMESK